MNIQFKKGVLEICVLALIKSRDYYGYELVQDISENINISEGSIYPLLRRLSKEGFFETYLKESPGGPPRKYYKITEQGSARTSNLKKEWFDFTDQVKILLEKGGDND
ncbi:MAG: PadR family transcriptional regulator [bacterium]|nr:PadR family transcriptional regulator [bacterium]